MILDEPNIYEIKRGKLITIINLLLGIGIIYYFSSRINGDIEGSRYGWITLDIVMLFFAFRGLYTQFMVLVKNTAHLSIRQSGIYIDNYGFIAKEEIQNIEMSQDEKGKPHLLVYLHEPERYLDKQNGLKKALYNVLYQQRGTPVAYRLRGFYEPADLEQAVQQFLKGVI
jgi:hypothetical protein